MHNTTNGIYTNDNNNNNNDDDDDDDDDDEEEEEEEEYRRRMMIIIIIIIIVMYIKAPHIGLMNTKHRGAVSRFKPAAAKCANDYPTIHMYATKLH